MENINQQDTGTGRSDTEAEQNAAEHTAGKSKPAQTGGASKRFTPAALLSFLQTDLADLQRRGWTVKIVSPVDTGMVVIGISCDGVRVGYADGSILVNDVPVSMLAAEQTFEEPR